MPTNIKTTYAKIENRERITCDEALMLYRNADLLSLGELANDIAREKNLFDIGYIIDRNINYTNVCALSCQFCNFSRKKMDVDAYTLNLNELDQKIRETIELGGTGILLQGGQHPDYKIDWYENLLQHICETFPNIHIHALSPPEIEHISRKSHLSYKETLKRLKEAGLKSLPGGGGEILVDRVRQLISKGKVSANSWLEIMMTAHRLGIPSSATMMFGHIETIEERLIHLDRLREAQDKTGGFFAFIPWTFQSKDTKLNQHYIFKPASSHEYLRILALSRIYLDNFKNIQVSWLTQGLKLGAVALHFGGNDLGSCMIEENVISQAGADNRANAETLCRTIKQSGFRPRQRNSCYQFL